MTPRATYRLQLHKAFDFRAAAATAPYLARLGVSHAYLSPIMTARAGSTHGYDVVDPTRLNPELGGEDGFRALVAEMRAHGLGMIVDIVPNHMAVGAENARWIDLLEGGEAAEAGRWFDIDWLPRDPDLAGRIALPFLGAPFGEALAAGDLRPIFDPNLQRIVIAYYDERFPLRRESYAELLRGAGLDELAARFEGARDPASFARARAALPAVRAQVEAALSGLSAPGRLETLLAAQHWRLAWWRTAGDEINWRRFFDITGLAGVRVEDPEVFEATHGAVLGLYGQGLVDGVRIDHIDGLADPEAYLVRLRARLAALDAERPAGAPPGPAYVVVEKILAQGEQLPAGWPVDGATGYEFMNDVSALLHDARGEEAFTELWRAQSARSHRFEAEERIARVELSASLFAGQLQTAARAFHRLARARASTRDVTLNALERALRVLVEVFPCYRTYATRDAGVTPPAMVQAAFAEARDLAGTDDHAVDFIVGAITATDDDDADLRGEAVTRFQQLTAPLAAKAVEDTAFYRYGRLLSRNDVGFDPGRFASSRAAFYGACEARGRLNPHTLLATATHDHKRGEDVRARLAVLSETPDLWRDRVGRWTELLAPERHGVMNADAYVLFQTLAGAWPLDLRCDDRQGLSAFAERVAAWQEKALREQKLRSSWLRPDAAYEAACAAFVARAMDPGHARAFLEDIGAFVDTIAPAGALNGLTQMFLRCTTPGAPDCYQGCEAWDLSLVDPDNRRPVDFDARRAALAADPDPAGLAARWRDGRVKQALLAKLLRARADAPSVFAAGGYAPVAVAGARSRSVVAFVRQTDGAAALAAACRLCAPALLGGDRIVPSAEWWGDTVLHLPAPLRTGVTSALGGEALALGATVEAAALFADLPVALLFA